MKEHRVYLLPFNSSWLSEEGQHKVHFGCTWRTALPKLLWKCWAVPAVRVAQCAAAVPAQMEPWLGELCPFAQQSARGPVASDGHSGTAGARDTRVLLSLHWEGVKSRGSFLWGLEDPQLELLLCYCTEVKLFWG